MPPRRGTGGPAQEERWRASPPALVETPVIHEPQPQQAEELLRTLDGLAGPVQRVQQRQLPTVRVLLKQRRESAHLPGHVNQLQIG